MLRGALQVILFSAGSAQPEAAGVAQQSNGHS